MSKYVVKTFDPDFSRLLETVDRAVLYELHNDNWKKTCIEGPLYVYTRKGKRSANMLIVNMLGEQNFSEPITEGLELQLMNMFLICKKEGGTTYGICFAEEQDMLQIALVLAKLINQAYDDKCKQSRERPRESREVNIASPTVLTQPQGKCCHQVKCTCDINGTIPQKVLDFFAKSRTESKFIFPDMPIRTYRNIIQTLKSDPTYSVAFIEQRQRDDTIQNELLLRSSSGSRLQTEIPAWLARALQTNSTNVGVRNDEFSTDSRVILQLFPPVSDARGTAMIPPIVIPSVEDEISAGSSSMAPTFVQSQQFFNSVPRQLFPTVNNYEGATMILSEDDEIAAGSSSSIGTALKDCLKNKSYFPEI